MKLVLKVYTKLKVYFTLMCFIFNTLFFKKGKLLNNFSAWRCVRSPAISGAPKSHPIKNERVLNNFILKKRKNLLKLFFFI